MEFCIFRRNLSILSMEITKYGMPSGETSMETLEDCLDRQGVWSRKYGAAMMGLVVASIAHDGKVLVGH